MLLSQINRHNRKGISPFLAMIKSLIKMFSRIFYGQTCPAFYIMSISRSENHTASCVLPLQDINAFSTQRLTHASNRAELSAHRSAFFMFRGAAISDRFGSLRINSAFPPLFSIKSASGVCHCIVQILYMRNFL